MVLPNAMTKNHVTVVLKGGRTYRGWVSACIKSRVDGSQWLLVESHTGLFRVCRPGQVTEGWNETAPKEKA